MSEVWVCGQPHKTVGGANTEAIANIELLRRMGVEVHLAQMNQDQPDPELVKKFESIGCIVHAQASPSDFKDKIVASWCNEYFLKVLPQIHEHGKPKEVIYFNCMTELSLLEKDRTAAGMITKHGFVSKYQQDQLMKQWRWVRGVKITPMEGYAPPFIFDSAIVPMSPGAGNNPHDKPIITRIGSDHPSKISSQIFVCNREIAVPHTLSLVGFGPECEKAFQGQFENEPDVEWMRPGLIPMERAYRNSDLIWHWTGGSRESFCRTMIEAWHMGVPFVCERDYAFPELVGDGSLRMMMCDGQEQFVAIITELLRQHPNYDEELYRHVVGAQRVRLSELNLNGRCEAAWRKVLET